MKKNIGKMSFTITVDHDKPETVAKVNNKILSAIISDKPEYVAGVFRDIAEYALEMAFNAEHSQDFVLPDFTNEERKKQAEKMLEAHRNIFSENEN